MSENVKGRPRPYDASARRARAHASRRAVLVAATALIEERGYAGTTIAAVAERAGVSAESVYKGFGSKAALVTTVLDVALAGDDAPVAVADRPETDRIRETADPATKLRLYAEGAVGRSARSAGVQLALRDGAPSDPTIAGLWQRLQDQRLTGTGMFARHLIQAGGLRPGVTEEEARDVLWTAISVEVYDLLVRQRGWSGEAYVAWLSRTLIATLVSP